MSGTQSGPGYRMNRAARLRISAINQKLVEREQMLQNLQRRNVHARVVLAQNNQRTSHRIFVDKLNSRNGEVIHAVLCSKVSSLSQGSEKNEKARSESVINLSTGGKEVLSYIKSKSSIEVMGSKTSSLKIASDKSVLIASKILLELSKENLDQDRIVDRPTGPRKSVSTQEPSGWRLLDYIKSYLTGPKRREVANPSTTQTNQREAEESSLSNNKQEENAAKPLLEGVKKEETEKSLLTSRKEENTEKSLLSNIKEENEVKSSCLKKSETRKSSTISWKQDVTEKSLLATKEKEEESVNTEDTLNSPQLPSATGNDGIVMCSRKDGECRKKLGEGIALFVKKLNPEPSGANVQVFQSSNNHEFQKTDGVKFTDDSGVSKGHLIDNSSLTRAASIVKETPSSVSTTSAKPSEKDISISPDEIKLAFSRIEEHESKLAAILRLKELAEIKRQELIETREKIRISLEEEIKYNKKLEQLITKVKAMRQALAVGGSVSKDNDQKSPQAP